MSGNATTTGSTDGSACNSSSVSMGDETTALRPRLRVGGNLVQLRLEAAGELRRAVTLALRMAMLAARHRELLLRREHEAVPPRDREVGDGDHVEQRDAVHAGPVVVVPEDRAEGDQGDRA